MALTASLLVSGTAAADQRGDDKLKAPSLGRDLSAHLSEGEVGLDDDPRAIALLQQEWTLLQQRAVDYLSDHPSPDEKEFKTNITSFQRQLGLRTNAPDTELIVLGDRTYLVQLPAEPTGIVFVIAPKQGRLKVVWTAADVQRLRAWRNSPVAAWSPLAARDSCRRHAYEDHSGHPDRCGPVQPAHIGKLPGDVHGNYRFYLYGQYSQRFGCTLSSQLTIWSWNSKEAVPLLASSYRDYCDSKGVRFDVKDIHVDVKRWFRSFGSYGDSSGREMDWRIRVNPA
jgi:hypothetical protein